jgi:hypothetical protein
MGAQSKSGIVPKTTKKKWRKWGIFDEVGLREKWGECGNGEPRRVEMAGERPAVVSRGWWRRWVVVGVEDLDVREEEGRRWGKIFVRRYSGMGGNGEEMT